MPDGSIYALLAKCAVSLDEPDIKNDKVHDTRHGLAYHSRTVFIIGPQKHFRLILRFPAAVGISTGEVFRLIDALQTAAVSKSVSFLLIRICLSK